MQLERHGLTTDPIMTVMLGLEPLQVGLMFWTGGDLGVEAPPAEIATSVSSLGVSCGQLGVHGECPLDDATANRWKAVLDEHGLTVVTVVMCFSGEDYASIPICAQTVGYVPPSTRHEREVRTYAVSDFARTLGVPGLAAHIGFVPADPLAAEYAAMVALMRRICDHCQTNGQTFAMETGQESPQEMLDFIAAVNRPNLRVNFDPANMVLYGSGAPLEALDALRDHVLTVHCKDGTWPEVAGEWGRETPLGDGDVGMDQFVTKLQEIGYTGPLTIEREIVGEEQRADIRRAIDLLTALRA